jgi:NAD(P)-dependent dehydrogenase (short-subunit alcohol dehydrogenase family)
MSGRLQQAFDLTGKVALVTGGGSGLGRVSCESLAEFGADVVCADLRNDRAEETVGLIQHYGHRAVPMQVDVTDYEQVRVLFAEVGRQFGGLDVLVNNAGIVSLPAGIHEFDVAVWKRVMSVNLDGSFYCMKEALRLMLPQKKGSIINVSSVAGMYGNDVFPAVAYVTSKAAVIGLTKQGATEYGESGGGQQHRAVARLENDNEEDREGGGGRWLGRLPRLRRVQLRHRTGDSFRRRVDGDLG